MEISRQLLAEQLIRTITRDTLAGRLSELEALVRSTGVRRADVRAVLSALHREGYLDVVRMKLTLAGFALGCSLIDAPVPAIRRALRSIAA